MLVPLGGQVGWSVHGFIPCLSDYHNLNCQLPTTSQRWPSSWSSCGSSHWRSPFQVCRFNSCMCKLPIYGPLNEAQNRWAASSVSRWVLVGLPIKTEAPVIPHHLTFIETWQGDWLPVFSLMPNLMCTHTSTWKSTGASTLQMYKFCGQYAWNEVKNVVDNGHKIRLFINTWKQ